jgi:iron(III) transport system ATP-binding protein
VSNVLIEGLNKRFDGKPPTTAIDDLNIEIPEGEFLVLLGPSGCGKTTTLRCLAGLESADTGRITLGGETVFDKRARINKSPDKRNLGMVFQSYALWPHMTVRKNIAYPLKARRIGEGLREGWVDAAAEMVDCTPLLDRFPGQLSGGQQQRVALARGMVARPGLVLFDEPLSNLDARLRDVLRMELSELHQRLGFTAVYVTHDQSEALALGNRLAIMKAGKIEQLGTPENIFQSPVSEYVAAFIGMENRLELEANDGTWYLGDQRVAQQTVGADVTNLTVRVRPDDIHVSHDGGERDDLAVDGTVVVSSFGGRHFDLTVDLGTQRVLARVPATTTSDRFVVGDRVRASIHPGDAAIFDGTGARVADSRTTIASKVTDAAR